MCNCCCAEVVALTPQIGVCAVQTPPVPVATLLAHLSVVTAAVPVPVVVPEVRIGVVRIDEIIVGGTGGPCPHWTALMDAYNQPIRESSTGLVILVETHA